MNALLFVFATLIAQQDVLTTTSSEVVVDVVVRDKKGKAVPGLSQADFRILEDGVPQQITAVREVRRGLVQDRAAASMPVDPSRSVRLISLVFDRLGIDSRRIARLAANDLLKADLAPDVHIAVFSTDLHLRVVQPFTNDRVKLRQAIEKVAGSSTMTNYADANSALNLALDSTKGGEGASAKGSGGPKGASVDGTAMAQEAMNSMIADMLEFAETSVQEQQGRSSIHGLWAVVKEQTRLPGRKTVLFFSEGLQIPSSLVGNFRSMLSSANRANVSIYAIDSRGLSINADNASGQAALNASLAVSQRQYRNTESSPVTRVEANQFDRAMDSIRANAQVNLQELAESTGGVLIANMNDFRKPIERIAEDLSAYYEIVYRPENRSADGSFRSITTKLIHGDYRVQSRTGYFALPTLSGATLMPFEVPLLKAFATTPLPKGVDFRAAVWQGRRMSGYVESSIIFEMPMKDITFRSIEDAYRAHVAFLALVKNSENQVIGKISNDLPVNLPKDKLKGFQAGSVFLTRPLKLAPGRYAIEASAADMEGTKVAARRTSLIVADTNPDQLSISTITLVRRLEQAASVPIAGDPFVVGDRRVVPTLQDHVPTGVGNALSLFFVIFPEESEFHPEASIEFVNGDEFVGSSRVELPSKYEGGRIPYIATIPLDRFKPGLHEIRVRATQGAHQALKTIFVTME